MKHYRVVFSPEAEEQLARLECYIAAAASPIIAANYTDAIITYCESLCTFPLRGTKRDEVERGQVLAAPKSITPHKKFKAEVLVLSKDEGGRHTPFFSGYRPQFYFRTTDITGVITLPEGVEMVMPGDNSQFIVELINPIAMQEQLRFAIREGGHTVGSGVVTEILE